VSFARPWLLLLVFAVPLWWWLRARRLAALPGTVLSDARPTTGVAERLWVALERIHGERRPVGQHAGAQHSALVLAEAHVRSVARVHRECLLGAHGLLAADGLARSFYVARARLPKPEKRRVRSDRRVGSTAYHNTTIQPVANGRGLRHERGAEAPHQQRPEGVLHRRLRRDDDAKLRRAGDVRRAGPEVRVDEAEAKLADGMLGITDAVNLLSVGR